MGELLIAIALLCLPEGVKIGIETQRSCQQQLAKCLLDKSKSVMVDIALLKCLADDKRISE